MSNNTTNSTNTGDFEFKLPESKKDSCGFVLGFISNGPRELNVMVGHDQEQCATLYAFHHMLKDLAFNE
jgi:hypothetical protein